MTLASYLPATLMVGVLAYAVGGVLTTAAALWGSLCGLSQGLGVWWFYAALGAGPISVVSPLTAVLAAGVPLAVGLGLGERPGAVAITGAVLALAAVILIGRDASDADERPHRFTRRVAWLTIGAGVAFGLNFVFIDRAPADAGLWPVFFVMLSASTVLITAAALSGNLRLPQGFPLKLALGASVVDVVANAAMLLALRAAMLSTTSVLMSLYPAVTVVLAIVVLRERVSSRQAAGMSAAVAAVVLMSLH